MGPVGCFGRRTYELAKQARVDFLDELRRRLGDLRRLPSSKSLFETPDGRVRIYVRYSKRHPRGRTFYGLRRSDLNQLQGTRSFICFVWDEQLEPLVVPYYKYEELFESVPPAPDGQYKVQVFLESDVRELYIANAGRFNVESHFGWSELEDVVESADLPEGSLSHSQVQTLLGAIGVVKGFQVWIPQPDRALLDWANVPRFEVVSSLPPGYESVRSIAEYVDVIWVSRGSGVLSALFEVEHSTTIYSGLLRFNDIHLVAPALQSRFSIVAEDVRRGRFARQLHRPTFQASGLHEICGFLEYPQVVRWYKRLSLETNRGG